MFARTVYSCILCGSQTNICSFNSLALIEEAEFVYCAVRTESLNKMQVNFGFNRVKICMNTSLPNRIYSSFLNRG
jgi:hypothetical protein